MVRAVRVTSTGRSRALTLLLVAGVGCGGDVPSASVVPVTPILPVGSCSVTGTALPATDLTVTLDAAQRFQTIEGFGTSERLFDDPHTTETFDAVTKRASAVPPPADQARILDALYVDLGLTRVRFLPTDFGNIEPVNDNADPMVADLTKFDFSWKQGDGHIALTKSMIARGLTTYYGAPGGLETWMTETNPAEYAEWVIVMLKYWKSQGLEMPYYSLKNEPGYRPSGGVWSGAYLRDVTKLLGARIKAEGLRTKIVVPDDVTPLEAYGRLVTILSDPEARQYVGAIAYHLYDFGGRDKVKALAAQYGIPVWMSEYSTPGDWLAWATITHDMLATYDASAVDYMWGFFGDWDRSQLIRILVSGSRYVGFDIQRQYYVTGQFSRFVRPGAVRIAASSPDPDIKVSAYLEGAKVVVVAINSGPRDRAVRFELGTVASCVTSGAAVRTSATENWVTLPAIAIDAPRFAVTLPTKSITTVVAK